MDRKKSILSGVGRTGRGRPHFAHQEMLAHCTPRKNSENGFRSCGRSLHVWKALGDGGSVTSVTEDAVAMVERQTAAASSASMLSPLCARNGSGCTCGGARALACRHRRRRRGLRAFCFPLVPPWPCQYAQPLHRLFHFYGAKKKFFLF